MVRKLVVEAIGTFFLVLTVGQVVLDPGSTGVLGPFAIASALAVMIYAGGHISGGHYNPAVTLAVFLRGKATIHEAIGYWVFQLVAGAVAATVVISIKGGGPLTVPTFALTKVMVGEALYTFALAYVVLNVATVRGVEGNSYYGIAIGLTVLAGAYAMGAVSGGHFNPAVTVGALVMGGVAGSDVPFFLAGQLIGGAAAGLVFRALDLGNDKATTATAADQAEPA